MILEWAGYSTFIWGAGTHRIGASLPGREDFLPFVSQTMLR